MHKVTYRSEYVYDIAVLPQTRMCLNKLTDVRSRHRVPQSASAVGIGVGCGAGCIQRDSRGQPS